MSPDTDFLRLYRLLRIEPGCSLLAFKQAYRRRVWELHPDRMGSGQHYSDGLTQLNLHYAAALDFHRLHGRLPGAKPAAAAYSSFIRNTGPPPAHPPSPRPRRLPQPSPAPRGRPSRWLVSALSLVAIAAIWQLLPHLGTELEPMSALAPAADPSDRLPDLLQLGMEADRAIQLLGQPISGADDDGHWLYGPSWVRFECGQVADWYSSPLHPLAVADRHPATTTATGKAAPAVRRRTGCARGPRLEASPQEDATVSQQRGSA